MKVTHVVTGRMTDRACVALVSANTSDTLASEQQFLAALRRALTAWALETEDGANAWSESVGDFCVGDLAFVPIQGRLQTLLAEVGLYSLSIELLSGASDHWTYSTVLIDEDLMNDAPFEES